MLNTVKKEISVVIPAYNEERRIGRTIVKISDYLTRGRIKHELIVVDDGSQDRTVEAVERVSKKIRGRIRLVKNSRNMGKGGSVKNGVDKASYSNILISDADLSTPIRELGKFLKYLRKDEVIIASRNLLGSDIKIKQPVLRQTFGKIFPMLVNLFLIKNIKDTQCGFKLMRRRDAKKIFKMMTIKGFAFDVELLFIARKLNYRIKEVPVEWSNSPGSKVRLFRDSIDMLFSLVKIRANNLFGRYDG